MNYFGRTIVLSLVIALVSFAGSFCLYPMSAQAADADSIDMSATHMNEQGMEDNTHIMQGGNTMTSTLNTCASNCMSVMPQVTATKKTGVDSGLNVLATVSQTEQSQFFELSPNPFNVTGTPPPSPDILSSVVKIE